MGLILWIDKNTLATGLLEKVFKQKDLPFYTLSSVEDFAYLVEDLRPSGIVLDFETANVGLHALKEQLESSEVLRTTPFISLGGEVSGIVNFQGKIERPFDPFEIPAILEKILSL